MPRGTVLKSRSVTVGVPGTGSGALPATQLLYRTQDERGRPTATVTTVVNPTGPLNLGLVAYLSFYDALGDKCSPSYTLRGGDPGAANSELAYSETALVLALAAQGYAVTVPDFEGPDLHWVAGHESGWNTLDGIRATESYLGMPSSQKVGLFGYSGGSIGGEWASELAPSYAPELNIVGTAIGGIPVHLAHNTRYVNGSDTWSGVMPAVLVSLGRAFGIKINKFASKYGKQVMAEVQDECIGSFNGNYPGLRIQQLLKKKYHAFLKVRPFARTINRLIMGSTPGHPLMPMFMAVGNADGTGDNVMIVKDVQGLAHQYCGEGVPVQLKVYDGAEHTQAGLQFFPEAMAFLAERFAGLPFAGNCAEIPVGNSLAPLKIRRSTTQHHARSPTAEHRRDCRRIGSAASTACAALWPATPDTTPPRRAPAPARKTRGSPVGTPHCWSGVSRRVRLLAHGQSRWPWWACPPGIASSASTSCGLFASRHGLPCASRASTDSIGSTRCSSSAAIARRTASSRPPCGSDANTDAGVCSVRMESVCEPGGASPSSDGSDSEGQHTSEGIVAGSRPWPGLVVRRLELGVRRADVQRARERHGRVDAGLEPGQPVEQQVDLELGALGLGLRVVGLAEQDVQHPRRHVRRARTTPRRWPARPRCRSRSR